MLMILSIDDVIKLKEKAEKISPNKIHFHDACGGQIFSFDEKCGAELKEFIINYFKDKNVNISFSEDDMYFSVR